MNNIYNLKRITSQYGDCEKTDKVFKTEAELKYSGIIEKSIRFIEKVQLLDRNLWKVTSEQFIVRPDDADEGWRGEYWGKIMRGACEVYEYTKSEELYNVLEETVKDMIAAADEKGRITGYSVECEFNGWDMWERKYVLLGFLHFYDICKSEEMKNTILDTMCAHADYITEHIGDGKIMIGDTSQVWEAVNSNSILEPMVRLYNITGNQRYFDLAKHIVDEGMAKECNLIDLAYENAIPPFKYPAIKAYEVMSCFEGLVEFYRITGNEKYKTAAINYVTALEETEDTIIGCLGCRGEHFDNAKVTQVYDEHHIYMLETCVTVTWMKLCLQIYRLTGDIKYIECIEKSYYNAMLGAVNTELAENAVCVFPFDSYSPVMIGQRGTGMENGMGGLKDIGDTYYGCCAAIGAMGLGIIPNISVMAENTGYVFNFYESGSISLKDSTGKILNINEKTNYPSKGGVKFEFSCEASVDMELKFRIPGCAENVKVLINNEEIKNVYPYTYLTLNRIWNNGDVLEIKFDFSLKNIVVKGTQTDPEKKHISFKYGPLVLARDLRFDKNTGKPVKSAEMAEIKSIDLSNDKYMLGTEIKMGNEVLNMIDYASAGKTLSEESLLEAWLSFEE